MHHRSFWRLCFGLFSVILQLKASERSPFNLLSLTLSQSYSMLGFCCVSPADVPPLFPLTDCAVLCPPLPSPDHRPARRGAGQLHQDQRHRRPGLHQGRGDGRHRRGVGLWQCQAGVQQGEAFWTGPLALRLISLFPPLLAVFTRLSVLALIWVVSCHLISLPVLSVSPQQSSAVRVVHELW